MQREMDEWLEQKIDEDLDAWAEERMKMLMESEELQDIHMPEDSLEKLHQKINARKKKLLGRKRIHMLVAAAAVMTALLGVGLVGSGKKVYEPKVTQNARGDEVTTKVNNADLTASQYDEEAVCQEIQDELGVLPIWFSYRPEGMELTWYQIDTDLGEAVLEYSIKDNTIHVYIFEKNSDSSIDLQYDGEVLETDMLESVGVEMPVYRREGSAQGSYYATVFDYLNTSYSISADVSEEEFKKIIENILIKDIIIL